MSHSDLYDALRKLSGVIRELADLTLHESDEAWQTVVAEVKQELAAGPAGMPESSGAADMVYRMLMIEIYDHLTMLVTSVRASQERLRQLATRDLLTGLYNRNYFNETIIRDVRRAERSHEKLSMIIIDIDNFKYINDTYGHRHGDGVLRECAKILRNSARKSDFVCRYGGDEFIIVTPMGSVEENGPLFARIQQNLDAWNHVYATFDYRLSLSIGCAVWEEHKDVIEVLHEADTRMYAEKQRKKDQNA